MIFFLSRGYVPDTMTSTASKHMKYFIAAALVVLLVMAGCARDAAEPKGGKELLVNATTRPADATPAVATPATEPDPSRPYYPRADLAAGYVVDPLWPLLKPSIPWGSMAGAALDASGNIWTLNRGQHPVQVFSSEGKLV